MPQLETLLTRSHTARLAICGPFHQHVQEVSGLRVQGEGMEGGAKPGIAPSDLAVPEGCPTPALTAGFQATSSLFFPHLAISHEKSQARL